jgi:ABC-2 type transport system ATP-binding protein
MIEEKKETYWSRFAEGYEEGVEYIVGTSIQNAITKKLSEERNLGKVLELGCGTGYFTKTISKNAEHVFATDLSDEMLQEARNKLEKYSNITIKKIGCENISFPQQSFDAVVAVNLLHFIEKPEVCLKESYRVLKDGGLLILVDYTGYGMNWFNRMKLIFRFLKMCGKPPAYTQAKLSPDGLKSLVKNAGFKIKDMQIIGDKTKALFLRGRK